MPTKYKIIIIPNRRSHMKPCSQVVFLAIIQSDKEKYMHYHKRVSFMLLNMKTIQMITYMILA